MAFLRKECPVLRFKGCPNITLNFLGGVDGVKYANTLDGATKTLQFLRFDFLNEMWIDLLYLPVYSPDLNPDEEYFSQMKYLTKVST